MLVLILGSLMYMIEGPEHGFTSIPKGVYWAIVTLTTVGYGDISPQTPLGQLVASAIMIIGYGIIAVPTAIVTAEMTQPQKDANNEMPDQLCASCGWLDHEHDADHWFDAMEDFPSLYYDLPFYKEGKYIHTHKLDIM